MDKETALHAIMLSELPHVGDKAAARILALNRKRHHSFATFFRLPEAVLREDYDLHPATIARLCGGRSEHESRCEWLLDRLAAAGGEAWLPDAGGISRPRAPATRSAAGGAVRLRVRGAAGRADVGGAQLAHASASMRFLPAWRRCKPRQRKASRWSAAA